MGSKKKTKDKRKNKPSPSTSNYGQCSSNFDIVSEGRNIKCFSWKISNFSFANTASIFSTDYFLLDGLQFRFQLFPNGEASRNTLGKYLGLYLEMKENDFTVPGNVPSRFICSEVVIANHFDDSSSKRKCIFHRFAYGSKCNGHKEFLSLDFLRDPQYGFLSNGTDLQIDVDVRILDDNGSFENLTRENQPGAEMASTSGTGARTENVDGIYKGKFIWTIKNYSLFAERFKNNGMLCSPPFQIGEARYRIHLESQRREFDPDEEYLSMFLDGEAVEDRDKSAYCFVAIGLWNTNEDKPEIIKKAYGRLGVEVARGVRYFLGWLNLMEMSKFEDPNKGYIVDKDRVQFFLYFSALEEREYVHLNSANAKTIWNLGAQPKVGSSSKKKDIALKTFTTYHWEILNLSTMVDLAEKNRIEVFRIRSRPIKIGDYETRFAFLPLGIRDYPGSIVLYVENLNRSCNLREEEMEMLVHYRLGIMNQIDPEKSIFKEMLVRFAIELDTTLVAQFPFPEIYNESGGYIVDDKIRFVVDIHQVDEKLHEIELPRLNDNLQRKLITWRVDNFFAWKGFINLETDPAERTPYSRCFEMQGRRIRLIVFYSGHLGASLHADGENLQSAGRHLSIRYRCEVANQRSSNTNRWGYGLMNETTKEHVILGDLADYLKEVDGYIVKDKIVFKCEIHEEE